MTDIANLKEWLADALISTGNDVFSRAYSEIARELQMPSDSSPEELAEAIIVALTKQMNEELATLRERMARAEEALREIAYIDQHRPAARVANECIATAHNALAARRPDPTEGTPDPTPARLPGDAQG